MTAQQDKSTKQIVMQKLAFRLAMLIALAFSAWILHFFVRVFLLWLAGIVG